FTGAWRWEVPSRDVPVAARASSASVRTLEGPAPKRPSAGLMSAGIWISATTGAYRLRETPAKHRPSAETESETREQGIRDGRWADRGEVRPTTRVGHPPSFTGPSLGASFDVGAGAFVEAHAGERDGVQGVVRGPVAASVEAVAVGAAGGVLVSGLEGAWGEFRPGHEMAGGGEDRHVQADLGEDHLPGARGACPCRF